MAIQFPKQKGNRYELKIAKRLSLWAYGTGYERIVGRTPTSGATYALGDLCLNEIEMGKFPTIIFPPFPFVGECKHDKQAALDDFIFTEKGFLNGVWKKVSHEAEQKADCAPILFTRIKRNDFVILEKNTYEKFFVQTIINGSAPLPDFNKIITKEEFTKYYSPFFAQTIKNGKVVKVFLFDDLFTKDRTGVLWKTP